MRTSRPATLTKCSECWAVNGSRSKLRADAVLIGGNFNLVGSRDPIDVLLNAGLHVDGSPLADVRALSLDGRTNATWRGIGGGRFTPGRLDATQDDGHRNTLGGAVRAEQQGGGEVLFVEGVGGVGGVERAEGAGRVTGGGGGEGR